MKQLITLVLAIASTLATAQVVNIPDANFKQWLIDKNYDTNADGQIQVSEAEAATDLHIIDVNITDLTGWEAFVNITSINLGNLPIQGEITFPGLNDVLYATVSNCPNITGINFGNLQNLTRATITENAALNTINLNNMANLIEITLHTNASLSNFAPSGLPVLTNLTCYGNSNLTSLNVTNLTNLTTLLCSNNALSQLDVSGLNSLTNLNCKGNQISQINLQGCVNLETIEATSNELLEIDLSLINNLVYLFISNNNLTSLDVSNKPQLSYIWCQGNDLTQLVVDNTPSISNLRCENNQLTSLDLSTSSLANVNCSNNQLETLFLKNGEFYGNVYIAGNSTLKYICANDGDIATLQQIVDGYGWNTVINTYCSFNPGGDYNTIKGNVQFDLDGNGCGPEEEFLPNQKIEISDGTTNGVTYTDSEGQYKFYVSNDLYTITPVFPNGFESQPATHTVSFPLQSSPVIAGFCLKPTVNQVQDVSVVAVLLSEEIRPGFPVNFQVIATNLGNVTSSGAMEFIFNPNQLDYVSSDPEASSVSSNKVVWNYSNLEPLKTYKTGVSFTAKTPTDPNNPLNSGDVVAYEAKIISNPVDANEDNNSFTGSTVVVNSFDPNDILCLEGNKLLTEKIGEYVHYRIRFENLGTANAINVVVKNEIDPNLFDISTLGPISSSHDYETSVNGNIIEFIFENINLPFDDATNDGYLVYKIKSLSNLVAGDVLENQADIYFDFNAPVITNLEETEFVTTLSIAEVTSNSKVNIYPNPATNFISIYSENSVEKLSIYNLNGQKLMSITQSNSLNISGLSNGIYLLQIQTEHNNITRKIIKK